MDSLVQREIVRSPGLDADAGLRTHGAEQANLRRGFGRRRATIAALEKIIHVQRRAAVGDRPPHRVNQSAVGFGERKETPRRNRWPSSPTHC